MMLGSIGSIGRVGSARRRGGGWWPQDSLATWDFARDRYHAASTEFTRASVAYGDDLAGDWSSFLSNVLRRTNKGILVEPAETNIVPNPYALSNWTQIGGSSTPLGVTLQGIFTEAYTVTSAGSSGHRLSCENMAFTSGETYYFCARYKAGTSGRARITAIDNTTPTNTSSITGALATPVAATSAAGTITVLSSVLADEVYETRFSFVPNFTGNGRIAIGPDSSTDGTIVAIGLQGGLSPAGSPILGLETRAADALVLNMTGDYDLRLTFDDGSQQFFLAQSGDFTVDPTTLNRSHIKEASAFSAGHIFLTGLSSLGEVVDTSAHVLLLPVYGQSLSIGARGQPLVSGTALLGSTCLTFLGGPRTLPASQTALDDLFETIDDGNDLGETLCSGLCRSVNALQVAAGQTPSAFFSFAPGEGAKDIGELSKGSIYYQRLLDGITNAKALLLLDGKTSSCPAVAWQQGEEDSSDVGVTQEAYYAALNQLQADLEADIKAITGQTTPVYLLVSQTNRPRAASGAAVDAAQLQAGNAGGKVLFVGAMSQFGGTAYDDGGTHKTGAGYYLMSHLFGTPLFQVLNGKRPQAFQPLSARVSGSTVYVRFGGLFAPKIDTDNIAGGLVATDYGVRVKDDTGNLTASNIRIEDGELAIDINRALGANPKVRFALEITTSGYSVSSGCMTNIVSSAPRYGTIDVTSYLLPEVAPHCEIAIT